MDDLISRQAAIDAVKNLLDSMIETDTIGFYEIEYALFEVPSAQPEIIRCGECRHYRTCEIFGKKITLCKRREYDALSVEPDDFCSYAERKEG